MANPVPEWRNVDALALVGPTASGKSALALAIAAAQPVEIISMDSAQLYRGMDIGTAKPSPQQRQQVAHHLIDLLEPTQAYSAAAFARDARRLIDQIRARGRLPLVVGGTMLYLKALQQGLDAMPAADPAVRAEIDALAGQHGWPWMHGQLAAVDPVTAARLHPNDAQRIQRALEVYRVSGQPLSAWQTGAPRHDAGKAPPVHIIALEPLQRGWLHQRIAERFDAMLAAGLVDEVRGLHSRGDLDASLPSMRCVGYRQVWEALEGKLPWAGLRDRGVAATRQLAKRQLTWLRAMPERQVVACDAPQALDQVLRLARSAATGLPLLRP
jgi:tRNA dimethylallyltransferase